MTKDSSIRKAGRLVVCIIVLALSTLLLNSNAYAYPVVYSLRGSGYAIDTVGNSQVMYGDISGTMIIESEPSGLTQQANGFGSLNWIISDLTITSSILDFNGSGSFRLSGDASGLNDWNEGSMSGYGTTPYSQGNMYFLEDIMPNVFYDQDGTPYEDSFAAYSAGLPYIIAPMTNQQVPIDPSDPFVTGAWRFGFDGSSSTDRSAAVISLYAQRETPPVPEPSTLILLGSGLAGLVGFRKKLKRNKPA